MPFQRWCIGCGGSCSAAGSQRPSRGRLNVCPSCQKRLDAMPEVGWVRPPPGLDHVGVLFPYERPVAGMVVAGKNRGRRDVLTYLASALGRGLADHGCLADQDGLADECDIVGSGAVVTWVPAGRSARRRRGYDQGRIIANAVGATVGLPARRLLVRRREPVRLGADRRRRLQGPDLRCPIACPGSVVLVDDVMTTGASLSVAASALRSAGAKWVIGLTLAAAQPETR